MGQETETTRGYRTHRGDSSNEESCLIMVQWKLFPPAPEQEAANWVRLVALITIITKQLRRRQTAGGRAVRRRQIRDCASVVITEMLDISCMINFIHKFSFFFWFSSVLSVELVFFPGTSLTLSNCLHVGLDELPTKRG